MVREVFRDGALLRMEYMFSIKEVNKLVHSNKIERKKPKISFNVNQKIKSYLMSWKLRVGYLCNNDYD